MKFLIDANLSPAVAAGLNEAGFESVHVADIGLHTASDDTILRYAASHGFVVVTADSDFGMLLALSRAESPSVLQLRSTADRPAAVHLELLLGALPPLLPALQGGAVASVSPERIRVRDLPIGR